MYTRTALIWILWVVSGALTIKRSQNWWYSNEAEALGAMSLTSFSICASSSPIFSDDLPFITLTDAVNVVMLYTVILGTLSASAHSRGATDVWRASAKLFDWNEGSSAGSLQI